ncbi:MAG: glutathione S-transferase domain-containing protein [Gammaproteobacteria bacterium]|nr:glutathione S-transferase domain-containing protein [Gammaproteobacteria bacterium]
MIGNRLLVHALFLSIAPIVVAWFGLSVPAAVLLVLLLLLWRWLVVLSGWVAPAKTPALVLVTIAASHFVEKVRWCMDRLGLDYVEQPAGGTLGAFFGGRTVPQLKVRTGAVQSVIGNSAEILRYLWGRYAADDPEAAAFLEPTKERVELEARLDRYGANLQVWIYYHILDERDLTLQAWGANDRATPYWQRLALKALFPLLRALIRRSFRISDAHYQKSVENIERLLDDAEERLANDARSLMGDPQANYVDLQLAALSALWLMPPEFGGGKAAGVRVEKENTPQRMQEDIERWSAAYPRVVHHVARLYREQRMKK